MNLAGPYLLCGEHPMMLFQPERDLVQGMLIEEENLRFISETGGNGPPRCARYSLRAAPAKARTSTEPRQARAAFLPQAIASS